jgi:hypothetical protein
VCTAADKGEDVLCLVDLTIIMKLQLGGSVEKGQQPKDAGGYQATTTPSCSKCKCGTAAAEVFLGDFFRASSTQTNNLVGFNHKEQSTRAQISRATKIHNAKLYSPLSLLLYSTGKNRHLSEKAAVLQSLACASACYNAVSRCCLALLSGEDMTASASVTDRLRGYQLV